MGKVKWRIHLHSPFSFIQAWVALWAATGSGHLTDLYSGPLVSPRGCSWEGISPVGALLALYADGQSSFQPAHTDFLIIWALGFSYSGACLGTGHLGE